MYLYFTNARKLQTMVAHGSPIRQGDSFDLYVCFDLDFFKDPSNAPYENGPLYCYYKLPKTSDFEVQALPLNCIDVRKFQRNSNDEVTYRLVDGQRYIMYKANFNANQLTERCGDLELVFSFYQLVDTNNDNSIQDEILNAASFSAKLYVEPTFGKSLPRPDSSISQTDYQNLLGEISRIAKKKNIALKKIEDIEYALNAKVEEKLLTRANYIYEKMAESKMGWVIIGATYKTVQQEVDGTMQDVEVIDVSDMYVLFSEDNMFVISSETGIIYKYTKYDNQYVLIPQMYSVSVFGDTLDSFIESLGKANLQELLQSFLNRIENLEVTTIQDIVYSGGKIKYKQNSSYSDLVTNAQLKEDLGINTIEGQGTFGVEYTTNKELKAKNGLNNEKTTLFTADSLKQDMNLDLVPNKAASGVIQNNENYFATVKAVFDTLENSAIGNENQNTNTTNFNEAMRRLRYMYQYFSEGTEDLDNKINKLEEIVQVLDNLPESADIYATINNIFNKIGEGEADSYFYNNDPNLTEEQRQSRTIKGRIEYLYENADKNIIVFIRYSEPGNQELLTIPVANWTALSQPNANYPDAEYYAIINPRTVENPNNPAFDNVVDMEVIFDKDSEKEYIVGAEFDTEQRVLNIYANSLPDAAITIDTIKLISNIHHTMSLNVAESNLLANHTVRLNGHDNDISNLTRDKQEKDNLINSWSTTPNETKYPSEALVKTEIDKKLNKATDADTNGQVKAITVDKTGATLTIKDATNYTRQIALINDDDVKNSQVQKETYSRDKIDRAFQNKIVSVKPQIKESSLASWGIKTWNGYTGINGNKIWTDGTNIYYSTSNNLNNYVLDKTTSTWIKKTWSNMSNLDATDIWTDGSDIYYSRYYYGVNGYVSTQKVLDKATSTWSDKIWDGFSNLNGDNIWTDGTNIYYSNQSEQYVLNKTNNEWTAKTWNVNVDGKYIWSDGENIYYSSGNATQYVLDKTNSTWVSKTWNGLSDVYITANKIWTDGTNIYYSDGALQLILDKSTSTWSSNHWSEYISISGDKIWTDGTNIYYSNGSTQYILKDYKTIIPKMNDVFENNPYTFLVKEFQTTPDDSHYPSEKLVKDSLDSQFHYRELMEQRPIDTSETSLGVVIGELSNINDYIEVLGYIYKTNSAGKEDRYRFNCLLKQPPLPGGGHMYYEEKQQLLRYSADSQSVILTVKCMYSVLDTSFKVNISVNSSGYNLMLESIRELINY